jgi:aldehyde dehydrogenase (NAD+)
VRVISFTGSTAVGRKVSESCAPTFKHACLEMGGKNVQIVMDDADLEMAVEGATWGAFGTQGQRCTATSRLICHKDVVGKVVAMLQKKVESLKIGNGLDETVHMGPLVNQDQLNTVLSYIEIGQKEDGAKMVTGGERLTGKGYDKGFFVKPTIFTEVTQKMRIWREEIFGPVLSIATFDTFEQAVEMANDTPYGLSASIYTRNLNLAYQAMRDIYTGIFYVNAPTIGAETHLPFGGTKETGNGHREAAVAALDVFSEWKSVYVDFSGRLQRAQIDNQ